MTVTSYRPEMAVQAFKLCLGGFTDERLADFFEVDVRTIYRWKKEHRDFAEAVESGKGPADAEVAHSLYRRANGYSYKAEKVVRDPTTKGYQPVEYEAHMPPDTIACIFWLKNRQPDKWRDVKQHEVGKPGDFSNLSDDELRARAADEAEALGYGDLAKKLRQNTPLIDVTPQIEAVAEEVAD